MKTLLSFSLLAGLLASLTASAMPIKSNSKGVQCRSGQICAMVCNKAGNVTYSLYEFAHYNSVDHFFTRIVQDDPNKTRDAQVQEAGERLGQVDLEIGTQFNKKFRTLVRNNEFDFGQRKKELLIPKDDECRSTKLAGYSRKNAEYLIDAKIYGHLGNTDRAGLISRLALIKVAMEKKVGPEHLVDLERLNRRLFYTEADDKTLSSVRHEAASTPSQLKQGISYRISVIFPTLPPVTGVKQLAELKPAPSIFNPSAPNAAPVNQATAAILPVAPNNNLAANIIPGSDVGVAPSVNNADPQNGYAIPKLVGLPPEVAMQAAQAQEMAANNGVPVGPETPADVMPPAENDPNNNVAPTLR
jgi:hypothetical protein